MHVKTSECRFARLDPVPVVPRLDPVPVVQDLTPCPGGLPPGAGDFRGALPGVQQLFLELDLDQPGGQRVGGAHPAQIWPRRNFCNLFKNRDPTAGIALP